MGRRRGLQPERREDRLVESVLALQQLVDAAQILARLGALNHAVIVRAGDLHHARDAEQPQRLFVRAREAGRIADRAGREDRALPEHEARHRRDRADAAGVGQRERCALQIAGGQLAVARRGDEFFVARAKRGEVERIGVADHRHEQRARAVLALGVDREPQMDAGLEARGRAGIVAPERVRDERHLLRRANQRVGDHVRKRDAFGASGGAHRAVELFAPRVEHVDLHGAEARGGWNREARLHVTGERGRGTLEPRQRGAGRNGRHRRSRRGGRAPSAVAGREHVGAQDQAVGPGAAHEFQVNAQPLGHPASGRVGEAGRRTVAPRGRRLGSRRRRRGRAVPRGGRRRRAARLRGGFGAFGFRRVNLGEHGSDGNGLALARVDRGHHARRRRRHLDVNLIGGHLDQCVALGDVVAGVLPPLDDRAFGYRFSHLREGDADEGLFQSSLHLTRARCRGLRLLRGRAA